MIARQNVIPPVTPRIVQADPRRRLILAGLLLSAFLLTAWFSYKAGQTQAPVNGKISTEQTQSSKQHINKLEQERDSLKQQVAELEQSVKQVSQALAAERIRNRVPRQTNTTKRKAPAPKPVANLTKPTVLSLGLDNIRIEQTASENVFRVAFSVSNKANNGDRITGTIWIAVNGFLDKQPRRISFKKLSSDKRSYVRMGFNQQQNVTEEILLPDNFRPQNILIEAKPYGEKYTGTSKKINWITNE